MGDRSGQLAERGDARDVSELGLRLLQRLLGMLGGSHIHQRTDIFQAITGVARGMGDDLDMLDAAVGEQQSMLDGPVLFGRTNLVKKPL
jgi:hypothetical protein